jgi:hypothetical protein
MPRTDAEIEAAVSLILKRRGIAIENGVMRAAIAAAFRAAGG